MGKLKGLKILRLLGLRVQVPLSAPPKPEFKGRSVDEIITEADSLRGWNDLLITEEEFLEHAILRDCYSFERFTDKEGRSYFFFMGKKARVLWEG